MLIWFWKLEFCIIIIITFQTANPNWESQMPKKPKAPQGRQPSKERENFRNKLKDNNNNNKKFDKTELKVNRKKNI